MVQLYVSQLRRLLDGNGARDRHPRARLRAAAIRRRRRRGRGSSACSTRRAPREALALWRGEALADVADEPFAAAEIRRLEELRLRAAELAIDADLAPAGTRGDRRARGARSTQHPLRERLHAQRMLALYRSGRQAEALEAYREARAVLVEQIGVEPGARAAAAAGRDPGPGPGARRSRLRRPRRPGRHRRGRRRAARAPVRSSRRRRSCCSPAWRRSPSAACSRRTALARHRRERRRA